MKLSMHLLFYLIICASCVSQTVVQRVEVVPPSPELEASSIWRTINDYSFLESQGYNINLPEGALIDSLVAKSKKGTFGNNDYQSIFSFVERNAFDLEDYEKATQKVQERIPLINSLIDQVVSQKDSWDWDFKLFPTYKIVFTLYGTGGSYDPEEGVITLLTNPEGGFMNYQDPANTIIHEITHMGMEQSIVQKHNLSHGLKERVVDSFVYLMFKEYLPEYRIQQMGDDLTDDSLKSKEDLASLGAILSKF